MSTRPDRVRFAVRGVLCLALLAPASSASAPTPPRTLSPEPARPSPSASASPAPAASRSARASASAVPPPLPEPPQPRPSPSPAPSPIERSADPALRPGRLRLIYWGYSMVDGDPRIRGQIEVLGHRRPYFVHVGDAIPGTPYSVEHILDDYGTIFLIKTRNPGGPNYRVRIPGTDGGPPTPKRIRATPPPWKATLDIQDARSDESPRVVARVPRGTPLDILAEDPKTHLSNWVRVRTLDGVTGWVREVYLVQR